MDGKVIDSEKKKKEEILTFILFHSFEVLFNIDRY